MCSAGAVLGVSSGGGASLWGLPSSRAGVGLLSQWQQFQGDAYNPHMLSKTACVTFSELQSGKASHLCNMWKGPGARVLEGPVIVGPLVEPHTS